MASVIEKRSKLSDYIEQIINYCVEVGDFDRLKNLTSFAFYLNEEEVDDYIKCYEEDYSDILTSEA